jgi:molybdenum cofactor cytidylyltransferase
MTRATARFAAIVLAAGSGTRFSDRPEGKLLALLDGRPLLCHVLTTVRSFRPAATVVVLGRGADAIESTLLWDREVRVRNAEPEHGIASSLRTGMDALTALPIELSGVLIVLGDQPWLDPATLHALADAAASAPRGKILVVPDYVEDPGPRNPALLLRSGWPLVATLLGDRGLSQLSDAHPELVLTVPVAGRMPDIDRPEDLERLRST